MKKISHEMMSLERKRLFCAGLEEASGFLQIASEPTWQMGFSEGPIIKGFQGCTY